MSEETPPCCRPNRHGNAETPYVENVIAQTSTRQIQLATAVRPTSRPSITAVCAGSSCLASSEDSSIGFTDVVFPRLVWRLGRFPVSSTWQTKMWSFRSIVSMHPQSWKFRDFCLENSGDNGAVILVGRCDGAQDQDFFGMLLCRRSSVINEVMMLSA